MYSNFLKRDNAIAVVGASSNHEKWGYRIYSHLLKGGFRVFPVNPKDASIGGNPCFRDIISLPEKPDLVITVVKPDVTESVVKDVHKAGIKMVWMQPGSESRNAIVYCKEHGIEVVYNSCYVVDGLKENW